MMTIGIWEDVLHRIKHPHYNKGVELHFVPQIILFTIVLTPISVILDILILPIEILYLLSKKVYRKLSDNNEN